jgi:hypothetical protein
MTRELGSEKRLPFRRRQQEGAHAGRLPDAQGAHVRLDELHGVVDRHAGRDRTARGVDVEENVLVRIFRFKEQQLGDDQVGRERH